MNVSPAPSGLDGSVVPIVSVPTSIESTYGPVCLTPTVTLPSDPARPPRQRIDVRVLHLVNGQHFSGAERVQSHLGRCLPDLGVAADFASVKPGRFADMLDTQDGRWGMGFRLPMRSRIDIRVAWTVRDLVAQQSYDLLHAHTPRTAMIAAIASRLTGIPWVYHVHSPASRDSSRAVLNRLNANLERLSIRRADHLITVSHSLRRHTLETAGVDPSRITVVHNGVPATTLTRRVPPAIGGRWTIGMVALVRPRKGLEVVLDALSILRRDRMSVRLRVVGPFETPAYERQIRDQIDRSNLEDQVDFVGFTNDITAELGRIDAMVLPSLFGEGLPMVVLEAMAAAVPVIATDVEGTPEAIRDGLDGLIAKAGSAASLAKQIRRLVQGDVSWRSLSESAHARHAEGFSDVTMAAGIAAVYRSVLGANR